MDANPIVLDESADDVVVVVVEGEHDIYTAPTLRERLDEALGKGGGIVVDLTAATFVDSSVLGALLDARRRASSSAPSTEESTNVAAVRSTTIPWPRSSASSSRSRSVGAV